MDHLSLFAAMLRSRFFEREIERLGSKGELHGSYHLSIGQEACHAGLAAALDRHDWIVPTHRCHGYNAARGTKLDRMFSEMFGARSGICRGLGGSMHMTDVSTCNLGSSAVVGSGISLAGGAALALDRSGRKNISAAIFGDGASSRGTLYEMMNMASIWSLPMLFFLENNHYGMSASSDRMIASDGIYKRAEGFLIPSEKIDGNDVIAVLTAVKRARDYILSEKKPYFIEAETYRMCGHSRSDKLVYRSREEEKEWEKRDPIVFFGKFLLDSGAYKEEILLETARKVNLEVSDALSQAEESRDDVLSVSEMMSFVSAPSPMQNSLSGTLHRGTYREAVREALDDILREDGRAFLMGEDIGIYGGCFGVTEGLSKKYPSKVIETPVSEETFTGMAAGAAMLGMHPVVEVMYGDFSTLASDALINHAAKAYFMSGGQLSCPMIYRTPIGGGTGHGAQHTQSLETMFLGVPGLIVAAPSDPYSAKALLKSANRENNPVLFFEHKALYGEEGEIGDSNAFLPLGKAIVHGNGGELLVTGYSRAFAEAGKVLRDMADRITFLDLATISPLDEEAIASHYTRIGKALIVEDTPLEGSVAESVLRIIASLPSYTPGSVRIVSALPSPVPFSPALESAVLVSGESIRAEAISMIGL